MPTLTRNGKVVANPWAIVDAEESLEDALGRADECLIVPARLWLDNRDALQASGKHVGVWLDSGEHPEIITDDVQSLPLIALNFPVFKDGRAFSAAVILRRHYDFKGELRAIGDVQRDLLFYMKRCGFDSFDLADNVKVKDALSALQDFRDSYQGTVEEPRPLFRRRHG